MSKYAPLADRLRGSGRTELRMTFGEIETIIGAELPESAKRHRAWWSNNPTNNVMTHAWLDAGYRSAEVDMAGRKLVFRRSAPAAQRVENPEDGSSGNHEEPRGGLLSGIFGALKGTVTVKPGTDLTEPVDTEWDAAR